MENKTIKYITILEDTPIKMEDGKKYNLCQCKCGNTKYILSSTLKSGRIRDCGCGKYMLDRMIGVKSGKLTVIETYRERKGKNQKVNIMCKCRCECGNIVTIPSSAITKGHRVSCGCVQHFNFNKYKGQFYNGIEILDLLDEKRKIVLCKCKCGNIFSCKLAKLTESKNPIIGCSKCPNFIQYTCKTKYIRKYKTEYNRIKRIYKGIKNRCYRRNDKDYHLYGARGIIICDEWLGENGFSNFEKWALTNGYNDKLTIDRIDTNKGYCPNNCRWVDFVVQANNRRNNIRYLFNGQMLTISQIAGLVHINKHTLRSRLRQGHDLKYALTTPIQRREDKNG